MKKLVRYFRCVSFVCFCVTCVFPSPKNCVWSFFGRDYYISRVTHECWWQTHNGSIDLHRTFFPFRIFLNVRFLCRLTSQKTQKLFMKTMSGVVNVKWIYTHLFWLINYKSSVIASSDGVDAIGCHFGWRVRARVIVFLSGFIFIYKYIHVENHNAKGKYVCAHFVCAYVLLFSSIGWVPAMTYHNTNNNNKIRIFGIGMSQWLDNGWFSLD